MSEEKQEKRGGFLAAVASRKLLGPTLWVGVVAVTLVALLYAIANWAGAQDWKEEESRWGAEGLPSVPELVPVPVPDEENFGALPAFDGIYRLHEPSDGKGPEALGSLRLDWGREDTAPDRKMPEVPPTGKHGKAVGFRPWIDYFDLTAPEGASEQEMARIVLAELERTRGDAFKELAKGIDLPFSQPTRDYYDGLEKQEFLYAVSSNHLFRVLRASQCLQLRGVAAAWTGEREAARETVGITLQLLKYASHGFWTGALVGRVIQDMALIVIEEGLAADLWTEEDLLWFDPNLPVVNWEDVMDEAMRWEAVAAIQGVDYIKRQGPAGFAEVGFMGNEGKWRNVAMQLFPGGWYERNKAHLARMFRELEEVPDGDRRLWRQRTMALEHEREVMAMKGRPSYYFVAMIWPSTVRSFENLAKAQASISQARIAIALQRYERDKGKLPARLSALVPQYLDAVPIDPVDGKPMRYRKISDEEMALWSIGVDEVDDGGSPPDSVLERKERKGDWVWGRP